MTVTVTRPCKTCAAPTETGELCAVHEEMLRRVRVCCGDWTRVTGPSVTTKHGPTAVILDPPYADTASRTAGLYAEDSLHVAHAAREWAIRHGDDPLMRIVLCGYDGEHAMPDNWAAVEWTGPAGFDGQNADRDNQNRKRERLWFSPHCLTAELAQPSLFDGLAS